MVGPFGSNGSLEFLERGCGLSAPMEGSLVFLERGCKSAGYGSLVFARDDGLSSLAVLKMLVLLLGS
jgi:hypothetical protein